MPDEKTPSVFVQNMAMLSQPDNFQKYILGYKGNGTPRAIYDVVRDCTGIGKKHKKHKKKKGDIPASGMSFYMSVKGKKHKKKKKGKKHWHIDGV